MWLGGEEEVRRRCIRSPRCWRGRVDYLEEVERKRRKNYY